MPRLTLPWHAPHTPRSNRPSTWQRAFSSIEWRDLHSAPGPERVCCWPQALAACSMCMLPDCDSVRVYAAVGPAAEHALQAVREAMHDLAKRLEAEEAARGG